MSSDRDEFGAFLVGFIVGGLTGAIVSLLFAPQSGEETRASSATRVLKYGIRPLNQRKKH